MAALCAVVLAVAAGCEPAPTPSPWESELVSVNAAGTQAGDEGSWSPVFSPDGTRIAFESYASDLTATPDTNGTTDVYVRDLETGTTTLVSTNAAGTRAAGGRSTSPVFSPDGATLAFTSDANDLGPADANDTDDIYLHDLSTGAVVLVSVDQDGVAVGKAADPAFGPDGTTIAFASEWYLGPSDTNGLLSDVALRDLDAGTTTPISVDATGASTGDLGSYEPAVSPDGTKVAFVSDATNLGPTDSNDRPDVYLRDLATGTTRLVSVDADGSDAGGGTLLAFGTDGGTIYFTSGSATDLVDLPDANGDGGDIFARDLTAGVTELVTVNAAGTATANGGADYIAMSDDRTAVAWATSADDLGPTDTNGDWDIYVHDLATGATSLASVAAGGGSANSMSRQPALSPDGSRVAFTSHATDLGPHDSDGTEVSSEITGLDARNSDVYVHDLASGATTMVSANQTGTDSGDDNAFGAVFSPDGSRLAYVTSATDMGYTDENFHEIDGPLPDIYLATFHGVDLSVTLAADAATVAPADTITYTAEIANAGPDASEASTVAVVIPDQAELGDVRTNGATCSPPEPGHPGVIMCDAGVLAPGASAEVTVTATTSAEPSTVLAAHAGASSETLELDGTDNLAHVEVTVAG